MSNYKLIKSYHMSPPVGTIVQPHRENYKDMYITKDLYPHKRINSKMVKQAEFFEEMKQWGTSKHWIITCLTHTSGNSIEYKDLDTIEDRYKRHIDAAILSVRDFIRTSDGVVFTNKSKVTIDGVPAVIIRITINTFGDLLFYSKGPGNLSYHEGSKFLDYNIQLQ